MMTTSHNTMTTMGIELSLPSPSTSAKLPKIQHIQNWPITTNHREQTFSIDQSHWKEIKTLSLLTNHIEKVFQLPPQYWPIRSEMDSLHIQYWPITLKTNSIYIHIHYWPITWKLIQNTFTIDQSQENTFIIDQSHWK